MIDPANIKPGDHIWVEVTPQPEYGSDCFYPRYDFERDTLPDSNISRYCQVTVDYLRPKILSITGYNQNAPHNRWHASLSLLETAYWNDPTIPEKYSIVDRFKAIGEELGQYSTKTTR